MDPNMKRTALRMIPYGLYVLTAESKAGAAAGRPCPSRECPQEGPVRLLLTGASGQLGAYLLRELTAAGAEVTAWSGARRDLRGERRLGGECDLEREIAGFAQGKPATGGAAGGGTGHASVSVACGSSSRRWAQSRSSMTAGESRGSH